MQPNSLWLIVPSCWLSGWTKKPHLNRVKIQPEFRLWVAGGIVVILVQRSGFDFLRLESESKVWVGILIDDNVLVQSVNMPRAPARSSWPWYDHLSLRGESCDKITSRNLWRTSSCFKYRNSVLKVCVLFRTNLLSFFLYWVIKVWHRLKSKLSSNQGGNERYLLAVLSLVFAFSCFLCVHFSNCGPSGSTSL